MGGHCHATPEDVVGSAWRFFLLARPDHNRVIVMHPQRKPPEIGQAYPTGWDETKMAAALGQCKYAGRWRVRRNARIFPRGTLLRFQPMGNPAL